MTRLTLILLLSMFGFSPATNPVYISGHVKKNPKDISAYIEGLQIIVKGDRKILARAQTDQNGNFNITFTPGKEKSFDFFCHGLGIDTLLIASVKGFESDTPDMTFLVPGVPQRNKLGMIICTRCRKADKVYEIAYGDGLPISMRISEDGDTTYSHLVGGRYHAQTCIVGAAKYYCDRDRVKF